MIVVPLISLEKRMTKNVFSWLLPRFVKTIHVELANETIYFLVAEILGEHNFLKLVDVFDDEILAGCSPEYNFSVFLILNNKSYTFNI